MANTWIIAVEPEIAALIEHGRAVGGSVVAVTVGGTPVAGVDRIVDVPLAEGVPAEAAAPAVAAAVAAEAGDVVLAANKPAERVLAGAVAARLGAPYLHGLKKIGQGSAELACSRPLAEGADWMSADRYIGVSGQSVAPDLYIAVGISGQIQHTVGMVDSKVVVAVNNDDKAPIFEGADYGIVADLYEALPAIVEAAK